MVYHIKEAICYFWGVLPKYTKLRDVTAWCIQTLCLCILAKVQESRCISHRPQVAKHQMIGQQCNEARRKEKTTPFGFDLMRSQVLHRAAHQYMDALRSGSAAA